MVRAKQKCSSSRACDLIFPSPVSLWMGEGGGERVSLLFFFLSLSLSLSLCSQGYSRISPLFLPLSTYNRNL